MKEMYETSLGEYELERMKILTGEDSKYILWVGKKSPLPAQIEELDQVYGKDYVLLMFKGKIDEPDDLVVALETLGVENVLAIVPILPLSILRNVLLHFHEKKIGVDVLWADMVLQYSGDRDGVEELDLKRDVVSVRKEKVMVYRFSGFKRILRVDVVFDPSFPEQRNKSQKEE